jgi:hypothetical protein
MSPSNIKNLSIGAAVLVFLAGGAYVYFKNPTIIPVDSILPQENLTVGADVLALIEKLKTISIDTKLFEQPLFTNLKDGTVPITPEQQGRNNPFLLIGLDN